MGFWNHNNMQNIALISESGEVKSYFELQEQAVEYSRLIPQRAVIALLCDYCISTVQFYYACLENGYVPIMLDKNVSSKYLKDICNAYHPQFIWSTAGIDAEMCLKKVDENLYQTTYEQYEVSPDLAIVLTTSGSTSNPKLVMLSKQNIVSNTDIMVNTFNLTKDDRGLVTLPLQYAYGLTFVHMHWMVGASIVLTESSVISMTFWNCFDKYQPTNMAGVPFTYELLDKIDFLNRDFGRLRFVTQSGGVLAEKIKQKFNEKLQNQAISLYVFLGQTEATGLVTYVPPNLLNTKTDSVGIAPKGISVVVDQLTGELIVKGSSVCMGYADSFIDFNNEDQNHGVFYSGDLAYIDDDEFLYLKGRMKRFAKILGVKISLDDIEKYLKMEYPDMSCACINRDDKILELYVSGEHSPREMIQALTKNMNALDESMFEIISCKSIARLTNGKIDYQMLEKQKKNRT